jgi:hypothetical protein
MPDRAMFKLDGDTFTKAYRRKLHTIGVEAIQRQLDELAERHTRPLALACFEADRANCHRGDFAAWFKDKTGVLIPEWQPEPAQLQLVDPEARAGMRSSEPEPSQPSEPHAAQ